MAVHLPLGEQAQKEAREIMLSSINLLKPATGIPVVSPSQDIVLGCYWLTKIQENKKGEGKVFSDSDEAILAWRSGDLDVRAKIKMPASKVKKNSIVKKEEKAVLIETSLGRVLFNETLPQDYVFVNDLINSKKLERIVADMIENYKQDVIEDVLDKIKDLGFEAATNSGVTWGMDDLKVPPEKGKIMEGAEKEIETIEHHFNRGLLSKEEKSGKIIEVWTKVKSEIEKLVPKTLPKGGSVFDIIDSGARGSWTQPVQMAGMKGLVINPAGQIIELPIRSSFKEGFDVLEYFISTHGARKGTADTALRTSTAGYLTRRLVDVSHDVIISDEDCNDKEGILISRKDADEIGQSLFYKLVGRTTLEDIKDGRKVLVNKGDIIGWNEMKKIEEAKVPEFRIASPITCKSIRGICQKCYGWSLGTNKLVNMGEAVGVVAAQAIGEPGTQLTMRTFHTGGVAGGGDITFGLPRVQEIFEARTPGGEAQVSKVDGKIVDITQEGIIKIKANPEEEGKIKKFIKRQGKKKLEDDDILEYKIPTGTAISVENGQDVKKGQKLCEGNLDLKELFKLRGKDDCWRYILKEVQNIYVSQGAPIHDKHIEIIIRQMFSRVRIKDLGDSYFSPGQIIERAKFMDSNNLLKKDKKDPAKAAPILLGISRIALTTDSFLSAASFQETSRVLIKACLEGKKDELRGLKENVIIGKLIPAGTGFKK
jgi:DNA-directed RNA polymerase subunit beta'